LREAAITLGCTQKEIEEDYYLIDIPDFIASMRKREAQDRIQLVQITNSKHMQPEDYKQFINGLYRQAGFEVNTSDFDRAKMDELHAFTARFFGSGKRKEGGG